MGLHCIRSALTFAACCLLAACVQSPNPSLALHNATLVDVNTGTLRANQTVLIEGSRISAVGSDGAVDVPDSAQRVDAGDRYLIPGLWDMHVHITDATELALPVLLANGVTGVRDAGGDIALLERLEAERAGGVRQAPRVVFSGPYVGSDKGLPFRLVVESAGDGRSAVNTLAGLDVDFIKIHNGVPRDAYFALMDAAAAHGLPVVGHIPLTVTPEEAAGAGQAGVEHFVSLFEGTLRNEFASDPETLLQQYVAEELDTLMRLFAEQGVAFTPTVYTYWIRAQRGALGERPDPRLRYVAPSMKAQWDEWYPVQARDSQAEILAGRERFYRTGLEVVEVAHRAGVMLLAGTDLAARDMLPGFHLHDELASMVEAGLAPHEALQTATSNPARFLELDQAGSIEAGMLADLVLLNANPLEDIRNTRRIEAVVADGEYLDRETLDAMLAEVERAVQIQTDD